MKRSLYFALPAVFAFNISNVSALEIDEKLTLRFLKVSGTKKTVLVNRGGEDGLVVGDHAKFFITAGVVARGVVEKVSPSRSVWSLYRIVDPNEITQDKVLNLKIASPVKITDDPSKSLKEEAIPGGTEVMNVADNSAGGGDEEIVVSDEDKDELKGLGFEEDAPKAASSGKAAAKGDSKKAKSTAVLEDVTPTYSTNTSKSWEVWGMLYVNALTGTVESDQATTTDSTGASGSAVDFSAGVEKYFLTSSSFLKELSLSLFVHKRSVESSSEQLKSSSDWFEYGLGANYHFYNSAAATNKLIGFAALTVGKGSATINSGATGSTSEIEADGTNTFFSGGVGAKYVLNNGFGLRALVDYYSSSEELEYETTTGTTTVTRTLSGPRIQFGISYRF